MTPGARIEFATQVHPARGRKPQTAARCARSAMATFCILGGRSHCLRAQLCYAYSLCIATQRTFLRLPPLLLSCVLHHKRNVYACKPTCVPPSALKFYWTLLKEKCLAEEQMQYRLYRYRCIGYNLNRRFLTSGGQVVDSTRIGYSSTGIVRTTGMYVGDRYCSVLCENLCCLFTFVLA